MKKAYWGDLATLEYGKSLRNYSKKKLSENQFRVFGTNGPIGWHDQALCNQSGIIIGRKGAYREVHFSSEPFFVIDTAFYLNLKSDSIDLKWAYYNLKNTNINHIDSGSAIPSTSREAFYKLPIKVPDLQKQKKIANILSTYDYLIENNRRRIELLEQSARLLYREWFVRLRFPGHEHTRVQDGVPDGWSKTSLADLCETISYGYTASASYEVNGPKFLRITDIVPEVINWEAVPSCNITDKKKEKFLLKKGDVVVARTGATTGYAKRMHKKHPETVFASYLVRLRFKEEIDDIMLGILIESEDYKNYIKAHVGGAAQPNANARIISGFPVLIPPKSLQLQFRSIVEPMLDQKEILQLQNQKLKQARNLLLPKLMSGEIAV